MSELHLPFIEAAILIPLLGSLVISRVGDPQRARRWSAGFAGLAFVASVAAWQDYDWLQRGLHAGEHVLEVQDRWRLLERVFAHKVFTIDQLSAPLLPLGALLYFLTSVATLRTKIRRFSFAGMLFSEAVLLATFSTKSPPLIVGLMIVGTIPPFFELRSRGSTGRIYALHMVLFAAMLVGGWLGTRAAAQSGHTSAVAAGVLLGAMLIRGGVFPFHTWLVHLFERASFGTALLFVTPMVGAYGALRLALPVAPDEVLRGLGVASLFTAVYASGMALVQRDVRRFFCYLLLSHSALVFVGLEMVKPVGLTGALCVWLSVGLSLGGFGLVLRALESRRGRLSLREYQGLYEHTPSLAVGFILTGLASVGFPGTIGFIGSELLVDGAVETYPSIGLGVVVAAALNGIALVRAYFLLFTGTRYQSSVSLRIVPREQFALLSFMALIFIGGFVPQWGVISRYYAAEEILEAHDKIVHHNDHDDDDEDDDDDDEEDDLDDFEGEEWLFEDLD